MKSTDNDKPSSRTRRPNHTGSLHKSKNHYVARVMYHGTKHEWSTGIRIDMKDERGRPCGREMAQKVLDGMTEPFRHEQEEFVTAIMLSKMKMAHEAADRAKASSGMLIVKNLGKEFAKSTRRTDITERHLKAYLACVSEFAE